MTLTNPDVKADLYAALDEQAIRCVIDTMMFQRPLLFNYATQGFIDHPELLYQPIQAHPAITGRNYPVISPMKEPLPVFGTRYLQEHYPPPPAGQQPPKLPEYYSLNYFAQITSVQVDFSPGNIITMPPELPSLPEQHFALHLAVAAGVGFPPAGMDLTKDPQAELPVLAPIESVCKFPMEVMLTGYATRVQDPNDPTAISVGIDGFEIIDLQPSGMECLIESFVKMEVRSVVVPQLIAYLHNALPGLVYQIDIKPHPPVVLPQAVKVALTPASDVVPHNPAFQNDTVEVYVELVEVVQWPS